MQQPDRLINLVLALVAAALLAICVQSIVGAAHFQEQKAKTEYGADD